jgi:hypothetical protein
MKRICEARGTLAHLEGYSHEAVYGSFRHAEIELFAFEQLPEAMERAANGHVRGKIVLSRN